MTDRNQVAAHDFWASQSKEERKKILDALQADETAADHDFNALPPQVRAGIAAGVRPPEEPAEDTAPTTRGGRHKRGDDD